jgi:hypothetical protein
MALFYAGLRVYLVTCLPGDVFTWLNDPGRAGLFFRIYRNKPGDPGLFKIYVINC